MSFLKASAKEQYALRLAICLADSYADKKPISLQEIANQEGISVKYLEELIMPFKKEKLVRSVAGRKGGYVFIQNPKKVSVKDIIWMIDKKPVVTVCLAGDNICLLDEDCSAKNVWQTVQLEMEKTLAKISLAKLK